MTIKIKLNGATLIGAKNPVWGDEKKTFILLDCKFSHYESIGLTENNGYYSFGASPDDIEEHGRQIFEKAKAGDYGTVGDYVPPEDPPSEE
tara:strand:+ start:493 stop:765 length:273 start_codon:yes stop_codon:yes gene_type:complete